MASTYLTRAFSSNTSSTKATWSFWVKFSNRINCMLFQARNANNSNAYRTYIRYGDSGTLDFIVYNGSGTVVGEYYTTRVLRDCNSWYHICYSIDTTLNTASDRLKLYINGVRETDFDSGNSTILAQDEAVKTTSSVFTDISRNGGVNNNFLDGLLSYYILTEGYVYQADTFGSTDTTTGEWKINPSPTISNWGTNGFFILKDGNSVTDQSGNSNNFTVGGGTLTKTEDNPSNVFATLNPLHIQGSTNRFITYGNTAFFTNTTAWGSMLSTLGFSSGKFYVEAKINALDSSTGYGSIAIQDINAFGSSGNTDANLMGNNASAGLGLDYRSGESSIKASNLTVSSNVGNFSNSDIIGMAIDMDNKALYIHRNGTYYQIGGVTGVPTSGSSKTGAITIPATVETCAIGLGSYSDKADFSINFGNGYFLSAAVSSAGTNASGNGIFEYDVPTGYTALSTKGLNL